MSKGEGETWGLREEKNNPPRHPHFHHHTLTPHPHPSPLTLMFQSKLKFLLKKVFSFEVQEEYLIFYDIQLLIIVLEL